jgi:hypothetical protein
MGPNSFTVSENCIHTFPGGTYDMTEEQGYVLDVAKLHLLQCYLQSLINYMADTGELRADFKAKELLDIARGLYDGRFKFIVEDYSKWKVEFHPGEYTVPELLYKGDNWEDVSWHNDACPSFHNPSLGVRVWVESVKPENRGYPEGCRFIVEQVTTCEDFCCLEYVNTLYECDEEESLLLFLANLEANSNPNNEETGNE